MPVGNLLMPELVRRLCWDYIPADHAGEDAAQLTEFVDSVLQAGDARQWQRELTAPVLAAALTQATTT